MCVGGCRGRHELQRRLSKRDNSVPAREWLIPLQVGKFGHDWPHTLHAFWATIRPFTFVCKSTVSECPASHIANLVEIEKVIFGYDHTRTILKGINMKVPRGKVVAIMGGSGCGKTTLLRLIGGSLRPSQGEVRVDGLTVSRLPHDALFAMRRKMGMLFQFGALFTDMSVFDNVAFQMREHTPLPEPMIRDLVMMKLQAVGLRGAANLMPSELSGGMARRVALAR